MALIVVTKTISGKFVDIIYNLAATQFDKTRLKIASVRSVDKLCNDAGVIFIFESNENSQPYIHQAFDSIDGDTDITTNDKLYDALNKIIDP